VLSGQRGGKSKKAARQTMKGRQAGPGTVTPTCRQSFKALWRRVEGGKHRLAIRLVVCASTAKSRHRVAAAHRHFDLADSSGSN